MLSTSNPREPQFSHLSSGPTVEQVTSVALVTGASSVHVLCAQSAQKGTPPRPHTTAGVFSSTKGCQLTSNS